MMVLLYGFSMMYLLAGLMSYELSILQTIVIALVCYLFDRLIYKTFRRFVTIVGTFLITLIIVALVLYRLDQLTLFLDNLIDFVKVYYLSISVETVTIDLVHQLVLIIIFGLLIMRLLQSYIATRGYNYAYLSGATILIIVVGFLMRSMNSVKDQEAFLLMMTSIIIYYFYSYYKEHSDLRHEFLPLLTTVGLFLIIIVLGSRLLYQIDSRPLSQERLTPTFELTSDVSFEISDDNKLSYYKQDAFPLQESFSYEGIEVLQIKTEHLNYLKADTYEVYENGQWTRSHDLPYLGEEDVKIQQSNAFDPIEYEKYYTLEDIRIIIKNVNTNILFVSNYDTVDHRFFDNIRVMNDPRRGIFFTNDVLETNYSYEFKAVEPAYGLEGYEQLVRTFSNEPYPVALKELAGPLSDSYQDITELALTITQGIDNKYDQALAVEDYLRNNYQYNENPGSVPKDLDPILYFLFESKEGFCQQFTTAYVLMLRSLDIPARYATGFYVDLSEPDPQDYPDFFEMDYVDNEFHGVFDRDAHTWPEAFFGEVGWVMFEPTPGKSYKADGLGDYEPLDFEAIQDQNQQSFVGSINPTSVIIFFIILIILIFLTLLFLLVRHQLRLKKESLTRKLIKVHYMIEKYMASVSCGREASETPREYAYRVDATLFDYKGPGYSALISGYEAVVYGDKEPTNKIVLDHMNYLVSVKKLIKRRLLRVFYMNLVIQEFMTIRMTKRSLK